MSDEQAGGDPPADLYPVYAARLRARGPDHPATIGSLWRLLVARLSDRGPTGSAQGGWPATDLPAGVEPDAIRLDVDHVEALAGALTAAVAWQDWCVERYGPDDATTLVATVLLAHSLAAADQMDGQIDSALVLAEDARDGLSDLAARPPRAVTPADLQVAEAVHHWILHLLGEEPRY